MVHGIQKLLDIPNTQNAFINMGLTSELAILVSLLEFIGGLVILFGVFTRIAAILLAINMIGAVLLTLSMGFTNGYELGLLYLSIMITLILTGPGDLSIEKNLLRREIFPKTILNRL